ncbi:MAG: 1-deoxy-D-xylulose-5-phosphate reductoisomerase [Planctomycetota bacterium]
MTQTRVAILGCTGSVGTQALAIVREHRDRFAVAGLQAHGRGAELVAQAREFDVDDVCLTGAADAPDGLRPGCRFHAGADGLLQLLDRAEPDVVLNGITGAAGLPASEWAVRNGRRLALANKESMVLAGGHLMALARRHGAEILPVDSEHCALHQCLRAGARAEVRRVLLTGSGGPFRQRDPATFASITPAEALRHPTWDMGPRITIGSATMMNKAFEVVEARWLFDLLPEQIEVVIHPQSIVHSMVEFVDGSILAQCGVPDMRVPILYCLGWPDRLPFAFAPFDPVRWARLEFAPVDPARFPAIGLAFEVLRRGGDSGALLNAADEELCRLFLDGAVPFPAIPDIARAVVTSRKARPVDGLAAVRAADAEGRAAALRLAAATPAAPLSADRSPTDTFADE